MPLTKEQLLQNRYKFIAPYPGSKWVVGDILELVREDLYKGKSFPTYWIRESILKEYPHIFQPLPWWSDRNKEDMPEYVKCIKTPDRIIMPGEVFKVLWNDYGCAKVENGPRIFTYTNCYEPATNEEYINQKQQ